MSCPREQHLHQAHFGCPLTLLNSLFTLLCANFTLLDAHLSHLDALLPFWAPIYPSRCPLYPFDLPQVVQPIGPAAQHVLPLAQLPAAAAPAPGSPVHIPGDGVQRPVLHEQSLRGRRRSPISSGAMCPRAERGARSVSAGFARTPSASAALNRTRSRRFPSALLPTGPLGERGAARAAADKTERPRFADAEGSERGTEPRLPAAPPRCHFPPSGLRAGPSHRGPQRCRSKRSERRAARDEPRGAAARLEAARCRRTEPNAPGRAAQRRRPRVTARSSAPPLREVPNTAAGAATRRCRDRSGNCAAPLRDPAGTGSDGTCRAGAPRAAPQPRDPPPLVHSKALRRRSVPSRPARPRRPGRLPPLRSAPPSPLGAAPLPLCRRRRARLSARPLGGRRGSGGARRRAAGAGRGAPSSRASRGH